METAVYNQEGKKTGNITLPQEVFGVPWNGDLMHQVVVTMRANARTSIAHTKNRGDVRGGGKKPWKQKGTGRARHGSTRSPIWRGGGVTFGPRNDKDYSRVLPKKMRARALSIALSQKFKDKELIFVDRLVFSEPKTKDAKQFITAIESLSVNGVLAGKKKNALFIALGSNDSDTEKSFQNMGHVKVGTVRNLNTLDTLQFRYVVIVDPERSLQTLTSRMTAKKKEK